MDKMVQDLKHGGIDTDTKQYFKLIPLADQLYDLLHKSPDTHKEWAEQFNIKGNNHKIIN